MKSVTPLRSSINWKRIDHKSPLGPCTRSSPVCNAPRHVFRVNRDLDVRLPIDFAEILDSSPEFGSWNRLLAGHLTSQIASLLQSEGCVVADVHVDESGLSQRFGESSDFPLIRPKRTTHGFLAHALKSTLSHILTSLHSRRLAHKQPVTWQQTAGKQNLICNPKFLCHSHEHEVFRFLHVCVVDQSVARTFP